MTYDLSMMSRTLLLWGWLALSLSFGLTGCAVPVAVATSAGLGAAQAGTSAWANGELRSASYADLDSVFDAVTLAMTDLEVEIVTERRNRRRAYIMAKEPGGPELRISMRRRTPTLTRIGVRVGMIGDLPSSRAVMLRIRHHLPPENVAASEQVDGTADKRK